MTGKTRNRIVSMNSVKHMVHLVAASPLSDSDQQQREKKQKSKMSGRIEQTMMRMTPSTDVDGFRDDTGDNSSSNNNNNHNSSNNNNSSSKWTITTKDTSIMSDNSFSSCLIDSKQESMDNARKLSDLLETEVPKPADIVTINGTRTILSELTTTPSRDESCISKKDGKNTDSHVSNKGLAVCYALYEKSKGQITNSHNNQLGTAPIMTEVVSKIEHPNETEKPTEVKRDNTSLKTPTVVEKTVNSDGEQRRQAQDESESRSSTMSSNSSHWMPTSPAGQRLHRLLVKQALLERKEKKRLVKISKAQSLECLSNGNEPTLDMLLGQDMDVHDPCHTVISGLSSVVISNKFEPKVIASYDCEDDKRKTLRKSKKTTKRRLSKERILGGELNDHNASNQPCRSSGQEISLQSSDGPLFPSVLERGDTFERPSLILGSRSSRSLERKSRSHQGFSPLERSSLCSLHEVTSKRRRDRGLSLDQSRRSSRRVKSSVESSLSNLHRSTNQSLEQRHDRGYSLDYAKRNRNRDVLDSSSSNVNNSTRKSLERRRDRGGSLDRSKKCVNLASLLLEPFPLSDNEWTGQALKNRRDRGGSLDRSSSICHVNGYSSELSVVHASISKSQELPGGLLVAESDCSRSSRKSHKGRSSRSLDRKSRGGGCGPKNCQRLQQTTESHPSGNDGPGLDISSLMRNTSDSIQSTSQSSRRSSSRRRRENLECARDRSSSVTTRSDRSIRSNYGSINLSPLESKDGHESLIQWLVEDPNSQILFLKWLSEKDRSSEIKHDCVVTGESIELGQNIASHMNDGRTQPSAQETTESRTPIAFTGKGVSIVRLNSLSPKHTPVESKGPFCVRNMVYPYHVEGVGASIAGSTTRSCDLSDTTPVARNSFTRQQQQQFSSKLEPLLQASPVNVITSAQPIGLMPAPSMSSSVPTEDHLLTPHICPDTLLEAILMGVVMSNRADISESKHTLQEKESEGNISRAVHSADGISVHSEITGLTNGSAFPLVPSTVRTISRTRVGNSSREPIVDVVDLPETRPLDIAPTSGIKLLIPRLKDGLDEPLSGSYGGSISPPDARSTSFGTVEVREYERILGDHPSCSDGLSISIDWEYRAVQSYCVDEWEATRSDVNRGSFHLDRKTREDMLCELGYDRQQFAKAMREMNKIKHQRRQTLQNLGAQRIEEAIESCGRKAIRAILHGGKNNCPN